MCVLHVAVCACVYSAVRIASYVTATSSERARARFNLVLRTIRYYTTTPPRVRSCAACSCICSSSRVHLARSRVSICSSILLDVEKCFIVVRGERRHASAKWSAATTTTKVTRRATAAAHSWHTTPFVGLNRTRRPLSVRSYAFYCAGRRDENGGARRRLDPAVL